MDWQTDNQVNDSLIAWQTGSASYRKTTVNSSSAGYWLAEFLKLDDQGFNLHCDHG